MSRGTRSRPLLVPVTTILRRPGVRHPLERQVLLGELRVGETYVPADSLLQLDLVLEAINDGITVTGTIRAPYRTECRRCLQAINADLQAEVLEIFERRPVEGETYPLTAEVIDLEPLARDTILLSLPLAPLCSENCVGPAPDLYPARSEAAEHSESGDRGDSEDSGAADSEDEPPIDPRWAALRQLRLD